MSLTRMTKNFNGHIEMTDILGFCLGIIQHISTSAARENANFPPLSFAELLPKSKSDS
ncbi:hypothetical protein X975_09268, partial [Stegodyphus mimosarum]